MVSLNGLGMNVQAYNKQAQLSSSGGVSSLSNYLSQSIGHDFGKIREYDGDSGSYDSSIDGSILSSDTDTSSKASTLSEEEIQQIEEIPDSNTTNKDLIKPKDILNKAYSGETHNFLPLKN